MNTVTLQDKPGGFFFTVQHQLYYSNREPVPVSDIIESLRGIERLVKLSPNVFHGLTGVDVQHIDVFVEHIESGSLLQKIILRFSFGTEEELMKFVDKVRAKVGEPAARNIFIGAVLASMFYLGAELLIKSEGGNTTTIQDNQVTIINLGAGEVDVTPETFRAIVEASVGDKKGLAGSTVNLLKPVRGDALASLTFDDNEHFVVPPEVSREVPARVQLQPDTKVETERKRAVRIRNVNRDSANTGWQARLPDKFGRSKISMRLSDGIDPEVLAGQAEVVGDVDIHYRYSAEKRGYEVTHIVLLQVY